MRISRRFHLNAEQAELDFVDIDTARDTPLFLDPYLLASCEDPWAIEASETVRSFFTFFLGLLYSDHKDEARQLFDHLHEPNETCLGMSRRKPQGRGVGDEDAERIFDSISESQAAKTGLLQDLEDCRVFVKGIGKDKASDMTTNIIRNHLIRYTIDQCRIWDISLRNGSSGVYWNAAARTWEMGFTDNLYLADRRILLVPKSVVSHCKAYAPEKYHRHFVLRFLQHEHLRLGTNLVQTRTRRRGREVIRFVTKKSLIEKGGAAFDKDYLSTFTQAHPEVFKNFRELQRGVSQSIPMQEFLQEDVSLICKHLEDKLTQVPVGFDHATSYHRIALSILDFIFYPYLTKPTAEVKIHEGRKRIDITFDNGATQGFFFALANQARLPCRYILGECKNYGREVGNPEIDQLSGRFSPNRGQVGLLLCRSVENMGLLLARCKDTLKDQRGLVIPLTDADLIAGLRGRAGAKDAPLEDRLNELHSFLTT